MNFAIPSTSLRVITIVVISISTAAILCTATLAFCLLWGSWREGSLLTAFVALTGQLIGSLTGLLVNTRTSPGTDSEMPKATVTSTTVTADKPIP